MNNRELFLEIDSSSSNILCEYGCGQVAKHKFKNGKVCCCSDAKSCPESRRKNRERNIGRKHSEETKKRMSLERKGEKNAMYGRHHTKESLNLIRDKVLKNTKRGIEHWAFNKKLPNNICKKMSLARKGKHIEEIIGETKGKKFRENMRQKMLNGQSKYLNSFPRDKEKLRKKYEKDRIRLLNGQASYMNSFIKNPSKPQVELYNRVKEMFPSAILNYPCTQLNYSLDIAIPYLKICFESDGSYWHKNNENDLERQKKIENLGWKVIRYYPVDTIKQVPSKEQIIKDLKGILKSEYCQ